MCPIERFSSPLPGLMMLATDDRPYRIRMYVNVVFYYYPPPATMAHTLHPLTPPLSLLHTSHRLYGDETLITEIAFCRHPFRSFVVGCCSMMNQRGGDDDMTQISESSQLFPWSSVRISIDGSSSQKKAPSVPDFSVRYDHHKKTQERSLRKEVGGVVVIRAQRYYTTLRLYYILYYLTMHVDRSATEACMYDASAAISSALTIEHF